MFRVLGVCNLLFVAILISGCNAPIPQNGAEFRQGIKESLFGKVDNLVVNRPYSAVTATFQKMTPACLNFSKVTKQRSNYGNRTIQTIGKGKLSVSAKSTELTFQTKSDYMDSALFPISVPADGVYYFAAYAYPEGDKTRVEIYYHFASEIIAEAVKGWASGDGMGCPDPNKIGTD